MMPMMLSILKRYLGMHAIAHLGRTLYLEAWHLVMQLC